MRRNRNQERRGQTILPFALSLIVLVGMAGLSVDAILAAIIRSNLTSSVDAALLAAARAPVNEMGTVADYVFDANFPSGQMLATSVQHTPLSYDPNTGVLSMQGSATSPTFFMKMFGHANVPISAMARAYRRDSGSTNGPKPVARFIMIDEETIDNGTPAIQAFCSEDGHDYSDECTNDDIADPYVREYLFTRPTSEGWLDKDNRTINLPTGQMDDEGLFEWRGEGMMVSDQGTPSFTVEQLINSTGPAANESNLDKIRDVYPMRQSDIEAMVDNIYCGLVWDSDISYDSSDQYAVLKGATMGLTGFEVLGLGGSGGSSSSFSGIQIKLLTQAETMAACASAATGEPMDTSDYNGDTDSGNPDGTIAVLIEVQ